MTSSGVSISSKAPLEKKSPTKTMRIPLNNASMIEV